MSLLDKNIINSINSLLKNGVKEVVLTGVDLTSWGGDIFGKPSLGLLVKKILKNIPHLPRLRLSSIDPAEVDFELMEAIENEERLMPHIHLSIQHGDDLILKRMKRRHLNRDVINFVKEVKTSKKKSKRYLYVKTKKGSKKVTNTTILKLLKSHFDYQ